MCHRCDALATLFIALDAVGVYEYGKREFVSVAQKELFRGMRAMALGNVRYAMTLRDRMGVYLRAHHDRNDEYDTVQYVALYGLLRDCLDAWICGAAS